ncbi:AMP-binding protein [Streptomyces sp. NPDC046805]|uniref:AMP-binding protein n=1 Tax=Streptomyces sp. NPDC046805 TaxID=3155134 RepID=UPI003410B6F6
MTNLRHTDPTPAYAGSDPAPGDPPTLEARLRAAALRAGAAPALLDATGVRATHHDVRRIRDGGRARLREAGVAKQDRVALVMVGDWRLAAALLAAMSAAATAVLDPALTDRELTVLLRQLSPKAIVADAESAPRLRALAGPGTPVLPWSVDQLDAAPSAVGDETWQPDDPALLLFTSGTTSTPKVVRLTQRNLAAAADSIGATLRLGSTDRALNAMPLYHGHGMFPGVLAPLVAGGSTVCTRPESADELLAVAGATAPTWYSAAPVVHHSFLAMTRGAPRIAEALRLRAVRSTSSALPPELLDRLEQTFSAPVVEAYALSEAPGQIASNPLDGPRKSGTVGRPQGTEIAVLSSDGEISDAPGSVGEVLVRGPNVMPGYLGVPDSEQPFLDGWLRTGDQASLDEDGYVTLSGRVADIITRGAEKFAPGEVEAVLAQHPAVRDVAVFGRAHPTLGEEAAAAVVLHEGASPAESELIAFAAARLATYKVPVLIHYMTALPRGKTGKIVRRRLRDMTARATRTGRRWAPPR